MRNLAILVGLPVLGLALMLDAGRAFGRDREVAVSGSCTHLTTPDRGAIVVTADTLDKDLQTAVKKTTEAYDRTREAVKRLTLEALELRTAEYSVNEVKEWEKNKNVFKGYRVRMGLRVATTSPQRLGEVIEIAAREGIRDVGQLTMFLSEDKLRAEHLACLDEAAKNARAKAEKLAASLGARAGEILSITENTAEKPPGPVPLGEVQTFRASLARTAPPQVEAGQQEINLTVQAIFALH